MAMAQTAILGLTARMALQMNINLHRMEATLTSQMMVACACILMERMGMAQVAIFAQMVHMAQAESTNLLQTEHMLTGNIPTSLWCIIL